VLRRGSEADRDGFGLIAAPSGTERLRWAALGCDRSAPQLLHERLPGLKTVAVRFGRPSDSVSAREGFGFILHGDEIARTGAVVDDLCKIKRYRVRLCVVEEYDVALLAEPADDAN
jgi:hypothetical protein